MIPFLFLPLCAFAGDTCESAPLWMVALQDSSEQLTTIVDEGGCTCGWEKLPGAHAFVATTPYETNMARLRAQVVVRGGFSEVAGTQSEGTCSSVAFERGHPEALTRISNITELPTFLGAYSNPQTETNLLYYRITTTGMVIFKAEMQRVCQEGCGFLKAARE